MSAVADRAVEATPTLEYLAPTGTASLAARVIAPPNSCGVAGSCTVLRFAGSSPHRSTSTRSSTSTDRLIRALGTDTLRS